MIGVTMTTMTTGTLARRWGLPYWRIRRAVDALQSQGRVTPVRAGAYRLLSAADVEAVRGELLRLGVRVTEPNA